MIKTTWKPDRRRSQNKGKIKVGKMFNILSGQKKARNFQLNGLCHNNWYIHIRFRKCPIAFSVTIDIFCKPSIHVMTDASIDTHAIVIKFLVGGLEVILVIPIFGCKFNPNDVIRCTNINYDFID